MRILRWISEVITVFLIAGCADLSTVKPSAPSSGRIDTGFAIISLTHRSRGVGVGAAEIMYSRVGKTEPPRGVRYASEEVRGNPISETVTIEQGGLLGVVAMIELPEGDYAINKWTINLSQATGFFGSARVSSEENGPPFNYPFTVNRGQITYLGNLQFSVLTRSQVEVQVQDMRDRDVRLLLEKFKKIEPDQIIYRLIGQQR